jgi:hypothetical protein
MTMRRGLCSQLTHVHCENPLCSVNHRFTIIAFVCTLSHWLRCEPRPKLHRCIEDYERGLRNAKKGKS